MKGCATLIGMGVVVFLYMGGIIFAFGAMQENSTGQLVLAWIMLGISCTIAFLQSRREKKTGSRYHLFTLILAILPVLLLLFSSGNVIFTSSTCTDRLVPGGKLVNCDLDGMDLSGIDLSGSNLSNASLRDASLRQANLQNANLENADLEGADLTDTNLQDAQFLNTKLIDVTGLTDEMLAGILEVPLGELPSALSTRRIWLDDQEDIRLVLAKVCRGEIVAEAADHDLTHPFHPLLILDDYGNYHTWSYDAREFHWEPMAIRHTELVACLGDQKRVKISTCGYMGIGGGSYDRYQYQMTIQLIEPRTGTVVAETQLLGSEPLGCPESIAAGSHVSDTGHKVFFEDFKEWVYSYVWTP